MVGGEDGATGGEGCPYVEDALVGAASEAQGGVALRQDEWTVNQHVDVAEKFFVLGIGEQLLEGVACEAPHIHIVGFQSLEQGEQFVVRLLERITARQGDGFLVFEQFCNSASGAICSPPIKSHECSLWHPWQWCEHPAK